jgi:hypothetical protein
VRCPFGSSPPPPPPNPAGSFPSTGLSRDWPSAASVTTGLVISLAFTAAPARVLDHRLARDVSGTKQLIDPESVNPLAPFPTWTAFPSSEYYGASDAHALRWGTAPLPA